MDRRQTPVAYWTAVAAAVLALLAGMIILTADAPYGTAAEIVRNQRFMAWVNILGGVGLALAIHAKWWIYSALAGVLILVNVMALAIQAVGYVMVVNIIVTAVSILLVVRARG